MSKKEKKRNEMAVLSLVTAVIIATSFAFGYLYGNKYSAKVDCSGNYSLGYDKGVSDGLNKCPVCLATDCSDESNESYYNGFYDGVEAARITIIEAGIQCDAGYDTSNGEPLIYWNCLSDYWASKFVGE